VGLTVTSVDEGNLTSCKVNQLGPLQTARKQRSYIGSSWTAPKAWMDADFLCTFLLAPLVQHRTGTVQWGRNNTRLNWYVHELSFMALQRHSAGTEYTLEWCNGNDRNCCEWVWKTNV